MSYWYDSRERNGYDVEIEWGENDHEKEPATKVDEPMRQDISF